MATLSAIGLTAGAGISFFAVSMTCFGIATWTQSVLVAARCAGRPKTVIYNPTPSHPCQNRGNVFWGWVPWVMKLNYATMLGGVPGTGTRDFGLSGLMLKVNLDGIVLIRFHHLCFRVSALAAILYILIVLPVFKTAQCSMITGDFDLPECLEQNFTDYQRFTIENVAHKLLHIEQNATGYNRFLEENVQPVDNTILEDMEVEGAGFFLARLYTVVFVSWIITCYTYVLLEKEWRDILAMRRVYFLEADHWSDRNAELHETLLREEREKSNGSFDDMESAKNYAKTRDPWVVHPESRDTVPNIELYSVLVGGLPGLPTEAYLQEGVKTVFSRKQSIDWQLAVTSAFFDHCVPNQPGFSSSVAAVTILPAASQITDAWKHWYKTAAKVRKLRFVRKEIAKRRKKEERRKKKDERRKKKREVSYGDESYDHQSNKSFYRKLKRKKKRKRKMRPSSVYTESDEKKKYYSEVLGNTDDLDVEKNLLHALKLGPEQTAVYSREFAQGAANMAPYGWNESKVRKASLTELLAMEKIAIIAVQDASHALRKAQDKIAENDFSGELSNDKDLTDFMLSATAAGRNMSAANDCEEYGEIANDHQTTMMEDGSRKSSFRESWLSFWSKKSSTAETGVGTVSTNKSVMPSRPSGSTSSRRSYLQNLEVVAPIVDDGNRGSREAIKNNSPVPRDVVKRDRISFGGNNGGNAQPWSRNSFDDLGLEAGLFLEQKNISSGHAQHMPRHLLKRSRSLDDADDFYNDESERSSVTSVENDKGHNLRASFRRSKSNDDIDILQQQGEVKLFLDGDVEESESDSSSIEKESYFDAIEAPPLTTSYSEEGDKPQDEHIRHPIPKYSVAEGDTEKSTSSRTNSIWDKLASENDRRSKIRKRLDSISKSSDDGKAMTAKKASFTDAEAIKSTIRTSNNTSNGKHVTDSRMFSIDDESSIRSFKNNDFGAGKITGSVRNLDSSDKDHRFSMTDDDVGLSYAFEEKAGLRRRQTNTTVDRSSKAVNEKWSKVIQIANESSSSRNKTDQVDPIESGSYSLCTIYSLWARIMIFIKSVFNPIKWHNHSADIVDPFAIAGESTFAVVTFTSRQAAVAARYCLADSRGTDRWHTVSQIPAPPLADAPVLNLSSFRGFVRPVTISINDRQKMIRHIIALALLGALYIFYIIPLTAVQKYLSPESLQAIFPDLDTWLQNEFMEYIFSGFIPALVWTGFYGICPPMFKAIANFGSNATSAACAEGSALRYFWWFMIVSAFTGTSLASAVIEGGGLNFGSSVQSVIVEAASEIPSNISATWLNWIIIRVFLVLPTQYILQMNAFLLSWIRLKAIARATQGGGSGGPIPYRLTVDSGVVMLCLLALAPASPLIAIAAFVYFLFSVPMLRWVLIFLYKPKFDIGGARFPFMFDMLVSGMIAGQILLGAMLFIRRAFGPAIMAFFPLLPTIFYRWVLLKRYLKAFTDVALLQTSLLDGWDTNEESSRSKREEFRQFLVDCHKAAYVPVCIASDEATVITSEPAVVVPVENDADEDDYDMSSVNSESQSLGGGDTESVHKTNRAPEHPTLYHPYEPQKQPGRMMRRASFGPSNYTPVSPFVSPRKKKLYLPKQLG